MQSLIFMTVMCANARGATRGGENLEKIVRRSGRAGAYGGGVRLQGQQSIDRRRKHRKRCQKLQLLIKTNRTVPTIVTMNHFGPPIPTGRRKSPLLPLFTIAVVVASFFFFCGPPLLSSEQIHVS